MQFLGAKFRIQLGPTVRNVIAHEVKIFYKSLRFAKLDINSNLGILFNLVVASVKSPHKI